MAKSECWLLRCRLKEVERRSDSHRSRLMSDMLWCSAEKSNVFTPERDGALAPIDCEELLILIIKLRSFGGQASDLVPLLSEVVEQFGLLLADDLVDLSEHVVVNGVEDPARLARGLALVRHVLVERGVRGLVEALDLLTVGRVRGEHRGLDGADAVALEVVHRWVLLQPRQVQPLRSREAPAMSRSLRGVLMERKLQDLDLRLMHRLNAWLH